MPFIFIFYFILFYFVLFYFVVYLFFSLNQWRAAEGTSSLLFITTGLESENESSL